MADENTQQAQNQGEERVYELSFHILPHVAEDDIVNRMADIRDRVEKNGGKIQKEEQPRFTDLAYRMEVKRENKRELYTNAYFSWIVFTASPAQALEIEGAVKQHGDILRCMVIKTDLTHVHAPRTTQPGTEASVGTQSTHSQKTSGPTRDQSTKTSSGTTIDEAIEKLVG